MFSKPYSIIFYTELAFGVIIHVAMLTAIPDTAQLAFTPSAELFFALWVVIFPLLLILFTIPFIWNKKFYLYGLKPGEKPVKMNEIYGQLIIAVVAVYIISTGADALIDSSAKTKITQEGIVKSAVCYKHKRGDFTLSSFNIVVKNANCSYEVSLPYQYCLENPSIEKIKGKYIVLHARKSKLGVVYDKIEWPKQS